MEFKNDNKKLIAFIFFMVMFIFSGIVKIVHFSKKIEILNRKIPFLSSLTHLGMILVILLEIFGSLILISLFKQKNKNLIIIQKIVYVLFFMFFFPISIFYFL